MTNRTNHCPTCGDWKWSGKACKCKPQQQTNRQMLLSAQQIDEGLIASDIANSHAMIKLLEDKVARYEAFIASIEKVLAGHYNGSVTIYSAWDKLKAKHLPNSMMEVE